MQKLPPSIDHALRTESSDSLMRVLFPCMMSGDDDGSFWKGRACHLLESLMPSLVFLRDKEEILLDFSLVLHYLDLDEMSALSERSDLPVTVTQLIKNHLAFMPGYRHGESIPDTCYEHFGYVSMQWAPILSTTNEPKLNTQQGLT